MENSLGELYLYTPFRREHRGVLTNLLEAIESMRAELQVESGLLASRNIVLIEAVPRACAEAINTVDVHLQFVAISSRDMGCCSGKRTIAHISSS